MIASGPFRGLFLFLGAAEFLHLIATRGASPQGPEKRLEFCEISHERGARSPANAPRDRTPPTPGTPRVGGGAAAQPPAGRRGGTATSGRGGLPRATTRALYGARAGRLPPAAPARAGRLPGKTGRFPGRTARLAGRLPCGVATPVAYTACAGAATGRARAGRRATPGAARRHSYPRAGATPGGYSRRSWRSYAASCDGYAPTSWGGRLPKPGLPGENPARPPFARI